MSWLLDPNNWLSLVTLTVLEIVLGVDNIIVIAILAGKLPAAQQGRARTIGLLFALLTRILLLCSIFWLTRMTAPLFDFLGHGFSGKDVVMVVGGVFLLWKSVHEIHGAVEHAERDPSAKAGATIAAVVAQIALMDIIFSLDTVITAVGLAQHLGVMITAIVLAMGVMMLAAKSISDFVNRHPTVKMLALSFLLLIGMVLIADGCGRHIEKGYVYFAMAFSFGVEMLNIRVRAKKG